MTWGEFKRGVDAMGIRDDEEISFIDWSGGPISAARCFYSGARTDVNISGWREGLREYEYGSDGQESA
jgi:hypothetical protein